MRKLTLVASLAGLMLLGAAGTSIGAVNPHGDRGVNKHPDRGAIPEPSTALLVGLGAVVLASARKRL